MKNRRNILILLAVAVMMIFQATATEAQHRRFKTPGTAPRPESHSIMQETNSPETGNSSTAQQAQDLLALEPIVGSWEATFTSVERPLPYPPIETLLTFNEDGSVVAVDSTSVPFSDGETLIAVSPGHGVWRKIGDHLYEAKIVQLINNNEGIFLERGVITARIRVDPTNDGFRGTDTFQAFFPDGTPVPDSTGNERNTGRRIKF